SNSSVGWGMFYQVVNIGGFIGPLVTGYLRLLEWRYAFFAAAGIILVNVLVTGLFLKDYAKGRDRESPERSKGPREVFVEAITTLKDLRFTVFLAIFSGFWFMFMQLFDQLSVFIDQWVDSNDVARFLAGVTGMEFFKNMAADGGQVNPEWIIDVDAGAIIVFVLLISYITGKFRHISAMIVGMFIACLGLIWCGTAVTGWTCVMGIFVFSIGEMACSPKFQEYIGLMAPPDKKALYMGYSNIPFAVGWAGANFIGGPLYDHLSDKHKLVRDYLVTQLGLEPSAVDALSKGDLMPTLAATLGDTERAAQELLWQNYHPQSFWYLCMGVGLLSTLAMVVYHFVLLAGAKKRSESSE
ncbi:MAG: MFS transporter, partial [Phycisphaerae bacterium]